MAKSQGDVGSNLKSQTASMSGGFSYLFDIGSEFRILACSTRFRLLVRLTNRLVKYNYLSFEASARVLLIHTADGGPGVRAHGWAEFLEAEPGAGLRRAGQADGDLEGYAFAQNVDGQLQILYAGIA